MTRGVILPDTRTSVCLPPDGGKTTNSPSENRFNPLYTEFQSPQLFWYYLMQISIINSKGVKSWHNIRMNETIPA